MHPYKPSVTELWNASPRFLLTMHDQNNSEDRSMIIYSVICLKQRCAQLHNNRNYQDDAFSKGSARSRILRHDGFGWWLPNISQWDADRVSTDTYHNT